ncbi:MAG: YfhO family protein [Nitrospinae bacterium]|nr:YfhO family protein [Nitrospinota bacterium]
MSKIDKDLLAATALAVFLAGFFSPILLEGKTVFFRDFTGLAYPVKFFIAQWYKEGVLPFWNPMAFNGEPLLAQMVPGVLYPLNLVFLLDDFTAAFNWFYVIQYAVLAFSTYGLLRYFKISPLSSLCASVSAVVSGFFLSLSGVNTTFFSAVWFPATFLCAQKYLVDRQAWFFPLSAVCLAFQTLGGSPEVCVFTVLVLFAHAVYFAPEEGRWRETLRRTVLLAAHVLAALGLAAPQLLPTYALVKESLRSAGFDFADHAVWSLQPQALMSLVLPEDLGRFLEREDVEKVHFHSIYVGLFAAFFMGAGILFYRKKEIRFWLAMFGAGIFFALGKYNPLYKYFYDWVPIFQKFRYPEKFYLIPAFSQIFLLGFGMDALVRNDREKALRLRPLFVLLSIVAGAVLSAGFWQAEKNPAPSLAYLAAFGAGYFLYRSGKMRADGLKALLLALVLADLLSRSSGVLPLIDKSFYDDPPPVAREIGLDKDHFRVYTGKVRGNPEEITFPAGISVLQRQLVFKQRLLPYRGMIYGISYPNGMLGNALQLNDPSLWAEIFEKSPPEKRLRILKRGNVRYWIDGDAPPETAEGKPSIIAEPPLRILDDALPRAFLVPNARLGKEPHLLNTYYDETFDPRAEVLLSEPGGKSPHPPFDKGGTLQQGGEPPASAPAGRQSAVADRLDPDGEQSSSRAIKAGPSRSGAFPGGIGSSGTLAGAEAGITPPCKGGRGDLPPGACSPVGEAHIESYGPNRVIIRTRQNGDGFLVLLDAYFPGWTATVDGKPERVLRANHFYRAVKLGPGEHAVEFSYVPPGFREGLAVSGVTAVVLLVSVAAVLWERKIRPV